MDESVFVTRHRLLISQAVLKILIRILIQILVLWIPSDRRCSNPLRRLARFAIALLIGVCATTVVSEQKNVEPVA
jgi:hypothetical protein